jgi:hypothetical protein
MSRRDAANAARRQFGNTTLLQERRREARGFLFPSNLWRDVRFEMRMLRKNFGSNAAVVVALALGIGMNTAVFSFVNAQLLRPATGVEAAWHLSQLLSTARIKNSSSFCHSNFNYDSTFVAARKSPSLRTVIYHIDFGFRCLGAGMKGSSLDESIPDADPLRCAV